MSLNNNLVYKDNNLSSLEISNLNNNLFNALNIIDEEVMKGYLSKLESLPIVKYNDNLKLNDMYFYKINKLVYNEKEFYINNLAMIFNTLVGTGCTLTLVIKGRSKNGENPNRTDFYLGIRDNREGLDRSSSQILEQTFEAFLPGSKIKPIFKENIIAEIGNIKKEKINSISCVSAIADYNEKENNEHEKFLQGLDKFIHSMLGKEYTAIFIANNITRDDIDYIKSQYENIYNQISPYSKININFSVTDNKSTSLGASSGKTFNISSTDTEGNTKGTSRNTSNTKGKSSSKSNSETKTKTDTKSNSQTKTEGTSTTTTHTGGVSASAGIPFVVSGTVSYSYSRSNTVSKSVSDTIGYSTSDGISTGKTYTVGTNESTTHGVGESESTSKSKSVTNGEGLSFMTNKVITDSFGNNKGITLNFENIRLNNILEKLKKQLERIEKSESYGMWNFAAYFLSEIDYNTRSASKIYRALISGDKTGVENTAINSWSGENVKKLIPYLKNYLNPVFEYTGFSYLGDRKEYINPSVILNTKELSLNMGLPKKSVVGLPVTKHSEFAKEIIINGFEKSKDNKERLDLGKVFNMGMELENTVVDIDVESLSMHTFVTGSTGSGKSTTIYSLLDKLMNRKVKDRKENIKFLVIEPAKGEYKNRFGNYKNVSVYGTNKKKTPLLRINPFSFPEDISVSEHIERLIEIFNVCWPMYAAMPAVLKDAIERAYIVSGWNLEESECKYTDLNGKPLYPTFKDVLNQIYVVVEASEYSDENKGNYKGALATRIKSLTNGIYKNIFTSDELGYKELFDENVIVDLSRIGSSETKSLIMGMLVIKLQEYRMASANFGNSPLKHVTVLEEAHNILKNTSISSPGEGSNVAAKSVEMLSNAIAEMRTYGEGFIIVDQAPGLMDMSAIRNTNTKIILRLPDLKDRELVGKAASLHDNQITELSKLETFVAAVYQNNWLEPVLCRIDTNFKEEKEYKFDNDFNSRKELSELDVVRLVHSVLDHEKVGSYSDEEKLEFIDILNKLNVSTETVINYINYQDHLNINLMSNTISSIIYDIFNAGEIIKLCNTKIGDFDLFLDEIINNLSPDIKIFSDEIQNRILLGIMKRNIELNNTEINTRIFEHIENYNTREV